MRAIHQKLVRDILTMKGQVLAIAIVIGSGVMVLIFFATSLDAVTQSRNHFYQTHNFAHIFSEAKRAPEIMAQRLKEIPGVNIVETRVRASARLEVQGFQDPITATILSIPQGRQPDLNRLHLRQGSLPQPDQLGQAVVSEAFALAHDLNTGDRIRAIIKGRMQTLTITGLALSPEFVYQIGPADLIPDYERYAVLWMNRRELANAFDLDGAFNSVSLTVQTRAQEKQVMDALDQILAPYGGVGSYDREDQPSNRILTDELQQLRTMAIVLPAIFLGVSAFLLNILLARIVRTQRQQIAVLKAFGYGNAAIGLHYALFTGLIVVIGSVLGVAFGAWAADGISELYAEYFRFPEMSFRIRPGTVGLAVLVALGAGLLGAARAVIEATGQAPAEAMRPPSPERFSLGLIERSFLGKLLDQPGKIIIRNISRHRLKTSMSILGIALSGSLLLLGSYQFGSVNHMLDIQYRKIQKMDLHLSFNDVVSQRAKSTLLALPGVHHVETYRSVQVRLSHGQRDYRTSILGLDKNPELRPVLDSSLQSVDIPQEGLLLTWYLADYLGLALGDLVRVEVMEGHRKTIDIPLAGIVEEPIGVSAYMNRIALNRVMREGPAISGAWLLTDQSMHPDLFARLWEFPGVAGISILSRSEDNIRGYIQDTVLYFMLILLILAGSIAFAMVYNNARIAFAERARELATLRVLGFTRTEVAWILIGEIILISIISIPLGWLLGAGFALLLNQAMSSDLFRLPFVMEPEIFAFSAGGVLLASALSLFSITRKINKLDMVLALKTE
ncbi:ABC transporter permease [Desulfonatronovibrio hydrogenovorans]|uniref:ABC transporter permease n=1 Tax=Desulfonatronovibrio hydrogenovorans TaxID=53245 RepID=UPI00048C48DD|nr:FtsX-like permease family protein [Desulfonatronovibrio hydrogenovorans]